MHFSHFHWPYSFLFNVWFSFLFLPNSVADKKALEVNPLCFNSLKELTSRWFVKSVSWEPKMESWALYIVLTNIINI